ncbi:hypothetical protein GW17_00025719 [Ensete ventricosum]|nr:hypothetical protein GW17_00025719 [Ensete ventricosum]
MELQPDDGPRSSLGIGPGSDDVVGPRREFVRRFVEGIRKLAGNMLGDHQKIPEASRLAGGLVFTQRGSVMDAGVPQEGGLGSGR